jgi:hypothetical protein
MPLEARKIKKRTTVEKQLNVDNTKVLKQRKIYCCEWLKWDAN